MDPTDRQATSGPTSARPPGDRTPLGVLGAYLMGGIALAWVPLDGCVSLLPWAAGSLGLGLYLQFKDQTWPAMGRVGFSFLALLLLGWPRGVSEVAEGLARAAPDAAPTAGVDIATGLAGCGYAFPGALVGGAIAALIGRRSA